MLYGEGEWVEERKDGRVEGWKRLEEEAQSNRMCYSSIKMDGVGKRGMGGRTEGGKRLEEEAQSRMNVLQQYQYGWCREKDGRAEVGKDGMVEVWMGGRTEGWKRLEEEAQSRMNVLQQYQDGCGTEKGNG